MRLHRFYVEQPLGEEVVIDNVPLIQQWTKVFRYTTDDSVILFNGNGLDTTYTLESVANKQCILRKSMSTASFVPTKNITLYLSLIKKDNFELVVQKATELGVARIVPVISERSEKKNLNESRLLKIAIEAAEQCGRGDIPKLAEIITLDEAISETEKHDSLSMLLQMGGENISTVLSENKNIMEFSIFIGPEGGWSKYEEEKLTEQLKCKVSLTRTVLRAETAAIAILSLLASN